MLYQTHAKIHLANIRSNIEGIRAAIGPSKKLLIAVKANAYGHGAIAVSKMAETSGVDWLGVATVPEGLELRAAGIRLPILKLSPAFPEEMSAAFKNDLSLTVCEKSNIDEAQRICSSAGLKGRVQLKVDTGMGRIGVSEQQAPVLATHIEQSCPALYLEGIFTHFPSSDELNHEYTVAQLGRFEAVVDAVYAAIGRKLELAHCSNSGAVLGYKAAWRDMVRPGVMVYGHYPDDAAPHSITLLPGMSIFTRLSFIKRVKEGTSIGYGRTAVAPRDTWIGTIPVGYADGFNRLLSNKGRALVAGSSYPVVGRVCMDQSMIDLGPETTARVGDEVVLMGRSGSEEITCEEWARVLGTITYEVTCQINYRVERVYDPY